MRVDIREILSSRLLRHSDIPFAKDDAHRFLPWLVGVMACMVTLLLYLGLTVNGWVIDRKSDYSAGFTVHIPASAESAGVVKILNAVKGTEGIASAERMSDAKLRESLKSWLGRSRDLDGLPLPHVLEAKIARKFIGSFDYDALEKKLGAIQPGVEVDARERWAGAFSDFAATLQRLMFMLAALLLVAMGAMVIFTARASLKLHARIVHLLHTLGAEDEYIARQFQREAFLLVLPGVFCGSVAAGVIYWAMGRYMATLPASLMPELSFSGIHLLLMLALPASCAASAWWVTRRSVQRQLAYSL